MPLSKGQIVFALIFALLFILGIIWTYRRDRSVNRVNYRGVYRILLFIVALFTLLYAYVRIKTSH